MAALTKLDFQAGYFAEIDESNRELFFENNIEKKYNSHVLKSLQ